MISKYLEVGIGVEYGGMRRVGVEPGGQRGQPARQQRARRDGRHRGRAQQLQPLHTPQPRRWVQEYYISNNRFC